MEKNRMDALRCADMIVERCHAMRVDDHDPGLSALLLRYRQSRAASPSDTASPATQGDEREELAHLICKGICQERGDSYNPDEPAADGDYVIADAILALGYTRTPQGAEPGDTREDIDEYVERYIRKLNWSQQSTDLERTLVAGNIRGFADALFSNFDITRKSPSPQKDTP